jgi:hypothetical protein
MRQKRVNCLDRLTLAAAAGRICMKAEFATILGGL